MTRPDAIERRLRSLGAAAAQRLRAERWAVDVVKGTPQARRARLAIEQVRVRRLVHRAGSADAALDQIVADALASAERPS